MKHISFPVLLLSMAALSAAAVLSSCKQQETYFQNPVIQTDLADPTIMRVGETYYAAGSSYNWGPEYPLYKSDDLVNWTQIGHIFEEKPSWVSNGFWAPELFAHDGKYYCFYSAGRVSDGKHCIGMAVAESPEGPYADKGVILDTGTEQIDAYVFDDDGQLYISWKAHGLDDCPQEAACARLSDDCLTVDAEQFTILKDDEGLGIEGQCMFKRGDWYYLLYSARCCCGAGSDYEVRVARAKSVEGPWEKYADNPILSGGTDEVQSMGHGSVVETPDGRLFYLCHAYLPDDLFYMSRRPFLSELTSSEDGWIACVTGPKGAVNQKAPFPGTMQVIRDSFEDDFCTDAIDPSWSYPSDPGQFNLLCQAPFKPEYTVSATLKSDAADSLRGIIFFGSFDDYVSLAVEGEQIVLKSSSEDSSETLSSVPLPDGELTLYATVSGAINAKFGWKCGDAEVSWLPDAVNLGRLMRWDSTFRPGIFASGDPRQDFDFFSMK